MVTGHPESPCLTTARGAGTVRDQIVGMIVGMKYGANALSPLEAMSQNVAHWNFATRPVQWIVVEGDGLTFWAAICALSFVPQHCEKHLLLKVPRSDSARAYAVSRTSTCSGVMSM